MALIQCAECHREVSDRATSCPGCGSPIAVAAIVGASGAPVPVVIEKTSKKHKRRMLIGFLIALLVSPFWVALGMQSANTMSAGGMAFWGLLTLIMLAAAILFVVGVIGAWWHHG